MSSLPHVPAPAWAAATSAAVFVAIASTPWADPLPPFEQPVLTSPYLTGPGSAAAAGHPHELFRLSAPSPARQLPRVLVHVDDWSAGNRVQTRHTLQPEGRVSVLGQVGTAPGAIPSGHHLLLVAVAPGWAWAPWSGAPGEEWQRFELPITVPVAPAQND